MEKSTFIGKGKEKNGRIQVTIKMSEAQQFISEFNGENYLRFTLSPLKSADKFGKTHTALAYHQEEKVTAE